MTEPKPISLNGLKEKRATVAKRAIKAKKVTKVTRAIKAIRAKRAEELLRWKSTIKANLS